MSKLYKILLAILIVSSISFTASAQQKYWSLHSGTDAITTDKAVARLAYPKEFKLFDLNIEPMRQALFSIVGSHPSSHSTIISLPNVDGQLEQFEVVEASNFAPELQAQFPEIRAFSGKGITDRSAMLKLSISPQGIQTMVFRTEKENEFIEAYSQDHTIYSVFKSLRKPGQLPWVCSTVDQKMVTDLNSKVGNTNRVESSTGELKTMRLAQSVTAEYSNYFGAFNSTQLPLVLTAINNTLTRCNGCYEKDLAVHLNLIPNESLIIYYDPTTDPYSPAGTGANGAWNGELQTNLTATIGEANYDIGHLFGASGGGGNAGCIGCVCVNGQKGSGFTSPADGIPMGDNFDIDYVVHEVGHQMGANHTFSFQLEGTGVNKEVGAGITIMGYAGITAEDPAPHSIDIYHEASIAQIQANLATKSCPITTNISANNATPVVLPVPNYTIPITTPFALTGSATDANPGDVLTYTWEQNDNSTTSGTNSVAFPTKTTGPNWLTFKGTTNPTRLCPELSTILAGLSITPPLPGGDAICNIEALSSVARTLNFRLTVRDNCPYSSTPPIKVGQTAFTDMTVTVDASTGPFLITSQNAPVSYPAGSTQTVTWSVNGTTGAPINCANVKISFSTDGGLTFPTVLSASTPNDGTETFTVPSTITSTGRIKVEAIGNIFFDINNANVSITPPLNGFTFNSPAAVIAACPAPNVMTSGNLTATYQGSFSGNISLTGSVVPAGPTVSFSNPTLTTGSPSTTVSLTGMAGLSPGNYTCTVTGTGTGAPTQTQNIVFTINPGAGPSITTQPVNQTVCVGATATFSVVSAGTYQWQLSTDNGTTWNNIGGANATSYTTAATTIAMNGYQYRVIVTGQCGSTTSSAAALTVNTLPAVTSNPTSLALCSGSAASFSVTGTGSVLAYQWQVSTDGGLTYNNIPAGAPYSGINAATLNISAVTVGMNNYMYRCVISGACTPSATSGAATLTVSASITISTNPTSQTVCEATTTSFTVAAAGSGLTYQWQVSTDGGITYNNIVAAAPYSGTTSPTLTITGVPPSFNGYRYRAVVSNGACTPGISTGAILTVNTFPVITVQPVNVTICAGSAASFSVTATTGVGTLSYQWQLSTDGGTTYSNISGATTNTFAQIGIPVTQNGYRFRVIVTAGCGSVNSTGVILTVNPLPSFTLNNLPTGLCLSDPALTLSASVGGGVWSGSGVSGSVFTPTVAGLGIKTVTYTVTALGCTTAVSSTIQVNECAERHRLLSNRLSAFIYPNPNNGHFSIRMNTDLYTNLGVKVFSSDGRLVKSATFTGIAFGSVIPMDISRLALGTYHLYLFNNERGAISRGVSIIFSMR